MRLFSVILLSCLLASCASSSGGGWKMPVDDSGANPNPDSYGSDGMTFDKAMPHREDFKPWEFYYKHCSTTGDESYYSATSYDCTGPSF